MRKMMPIIVEDTDPPFGPIAIMKYSDDGLYVPEADYAALEARHNALKEAVSWERECAAVTLPDAYYHYPDNRKNRIVNGHGELHRLRDCARAEVGQLLEVIPHIDLARGRFFKHKNGVAMKREDIARVCHEVNRAYCQAIGDNSQPSWEDAADWMKSSAMNGVNLHCDNPSAGPEASHESWMAEKYENGWIYGPVKNAETKEHPCLVPFADLPKEQQAKDFIFRAVVHALNSLT